MESEAPVPMISRTFSPDREWREPVAPMMDQVSFLVCWNQVTLKPLQEGEKQALALTLKLAAPNIY